MRRLGEPAPGPAADLLPPPDRSQLWPRSPTSSSTRWAWSGAGRSWSGGSAVWSASIEALTALAGRRAPSTARHPRHRSVDRGAEAVRVAFGDPDAVSVGDAHLPDLVAWALAGEPRADDARMLELLAPYPGQRGRVVRLLEVSRIEIPRFGPRFAPRRIERI